ncbi:MAG: Lrp/AsnC ligand binding domain-containing protein [Aigarchaeota archaeon]|nr:Lrp/AsnC ligand binding domain-containing protein [Aigarchaeota archaeon]MDW8093325.1 Lrp/AsnC ligand binding domain-containing protein [Nitrososphaerota archaeon]
MAVQAFVLINTRAGSAKKVADEISKIGGCKSVCTVTGRYDVIVLIESADLKAAGDLILTKIHKIDGVERTETAIVV